jgi:Pycsar effector protein
MRWGKQPRAPVPQPPDPTMVAVENAWRIHAALVDWTGKVDTKASFALAIEAAAVAAVITLTDKDRQLSHLEDGWQLGLFSAGVVLLVIGILLSVAVVIPQLRTRRAADEWPSGYIYFGHLRHWSPTALTDRLKGGDTLDVLARQLVAMSHIAWRKHRYLQLSLLSSVLGAGLILLAGLLAH